MCVKFVSVFVCLRNSCLFTCWGGLQESEISVHVSLDPVYGWFCGKPSGSLAVSTCHSTAAFSASAATVDQLLPVWLGALLLECVTSCASLIGCVIAMSSCRVGEFIVVFTGLSVAFMIPAPLPPIRPSVIVAGQRVCCFFKASCIRLWSWNNIVKCIDKMITVRDIFRHVEDYVQFGWRNFWWLTPV